MIFDNIQNFMVYLGASPAVDTALREAYRMSDKTAVGRYDFADGVFCNVMCVAQPKAVCDAVFEGHKRYLDLQFVLQGEEHALIAKPETLTVLEEYDPKRDIGFFVGGGAEIVAKQGDFYLVYPWDAHAPSLSRDGSEIKKAVFKIPFGG